MINGVDDATIPNGWGSFTFDDEGTPAHRTVLFTEGVLQSFLYDRLRADKDGVGSTGNGRRQSYASPPIVRMTNTNILYGASSRPRRCSPTQAGVYVTSLGGGQVNPATGDFVFGVSEGYLIEDGETTTPVRGADLIGRAIEVMGAVDAVADDFDTWKASAARTARALPWAAVRRRSASRRSPWGAPVPDLGDLVRAAVEAAESDEGVEAYAEESRQTEASAPRGEVEGLSSPNPGAWGCG